MVNLPSSRAGPGRDQAMSARTKRTIDEKVWSEKWPTEPTNHMPDETLAKETPSHPAGARPILTWPASSPPSNPAPTPTPRPKHRRRARQPEPSPTRRPKLEPIPSLTDLSLDTTGRREPAVTPERSVPRHASGQILRQVRTNRTFALLFSAGESRTRHHPLTSSAESKQK